MNDTARLSRSDFLKLSAVEQRAAPLTHALEGHVKHRDHEDPNSARSDHAGENRRSDVVPADLRGALSNDQRIDAEDEGKRGHQDRAKTHSCPQYCRFPYVLAL